MKNKNIFLLSTDRESNLYYNTELPNNLVFNLNNFPLHEDLIRDKFQPQFIYITDNEEIKDVRPYKGKWHLEKGKILNKFPNYLTDLSECKLVIMTTDPTLIADGVQEIDSSFLSFFAENPIDYVKVVWNVISDGYEPDANGRDMIKLKR